MSLIQPVIVSDTPATRMAKEIRARVQTNWAGMIQAQIDIYDRLWKSQEYTPQAVLDALGTDATQLFQLGAVNVGAILTIKPDALTEEQYKPPFVCTFNPDGTVTVTTTPNT